MKLFDKGTTTIRESLISSVTMDYPNSELKISLLQSESIFIGYTNPQDMEADYKKISVMIENMEKIQEQTLKMQLSALEQIQ